MVATRLEGAEASGCRVIRPRFAVNWPQTVRCYLGIVAVTGGVAVGFALLGFWPILPFAGLELAALGAALYSSAQRSLDCQVLRLSGDEVQIEKGRHGRAPVRRWAFQRVWSEVVVRPGVRRGHPCRVFIVSRGEAVELGEFLDDEARRALARELQEWIGPMGRNGRGDGGE